MQTDRDLRIAIVGNSSSGKTTISRYLLSQTNLPYHSIDAISWDGNGELITEEVRKETHIEIAAGTRWIIDGNSNQSLARATHIVYLNTERLTCFVRCIVRAFALKLRFKTDFIPFPVSRLPSNLKFIWNFSGIFGNKLDEMALKDDRFIILSRGYDKLYVYNSVKI